MLRLSVSSAILTTVMSVLRSRGLEQFGSDDKKMAALDIKPLLQFDSGQTVAKKRSNPVPTLSSFSSKCI